MEKSEHDRVVQDYCEELQKNGYRVFIPKGRPDAIAIKEGKVFAVEVLKSPYNNLPNIKRRKMRLYEGFDGVLFKEFGPLRACSGSGCHGLIHKKLREGGVKTQTLSEAQKLWRVSTPI